MAFALPKELKNDIPQTTWGKILSATPVVMTVIATMLAGLQSSEMSRAQYDRSLAAELQSKAGDQWGLFQAKRLRGALQRSTLDIVDGGGGFDPAILDRAEAGSATGTGPAAPDKDLATLVHSAEGQAAIVALKEGRVPGTGTAGTFPPYVKAALAALADNRPEPEIMDRLSYVDGATLAAALQTADDRSRALDAATAPVNRTIDRLESLVGRSASAESSNPVLARFKTARLRYTAARYDAEAKINQDIASLYELQVRKANQSADRHRTRSQRFFYGMLATQAAVILATLAMAARQRNLLWSVAAAAGLGAIGFAAYVYLYT